MELLAPWSALEDERRSSPEVQLARELPPGHALEGKSVRAHAARGDHDDVLLEVVGEGYAVVHLTWSRATEGPWPSTELFSSLEAWRDRRTTPDHDDE